MGEWGCALFWVHELLGGGLCVGVSRELPLEEIPGNLWVFWHGAGLRGGRTPKGELGSADNGVSAVLPPRDAR